MTMDIELISFDLCPFVQRSVITLLEKNIPFKRTNIDLANKPEWFLQISPLGKVPVLRINGNILFESAVINEYLDEITPPSMHPQDSLQKAVNRAWIEFGSELSNLSFRMLITQDNKVAEDSLQALRDKFEFLDRNLEPAPFFNGADFSLIDAAYAPVFIRIEYLLKQVIDDVIPPDCGRVLAWSDAILARPSVQGSIIDRFTELATERFKKRGGILLQGIKGSE
ncbi:MAG: glutathione S-transferase family protein [Gammaproteobacteria bacterium]|nr:glutathione S-transferase family protein [Gammaproteobacteria bacterium]